MRFEDTTNPGYEPAKLAEDPLKEPSPRDFAEAFLTKLTPAVLSALQAEGASRGAARRAQCLSSAAEGTIPAVQCWAESSLWESGREPPASDFLQHLASSAGVTEQPHCR